MTTDPSTVDASISNGGAIGLPRRFLRSFLLLSLQRDGRSHGYELFECVSALGLVVDMAGVYRDLRAMDRHDLVDSDWEPSESGPDRRVYDLTDEGHAAASRAIEELTATRNGISAALEYFESADDTPSADSAIPGCGP